MKMEIKNKIKWGLCAVAAALAVMGLCFAWRCPLDCVYGVDSGIFLFKRQLLWNVLGIAACAGAAFVPWRRWLKLAPWGMVAWLALSVVAMFSPMRHGSHRWADFGIVCINVDLVLVFAWALFSAWLCSKRYIRPWMIFAFIGGLLIAWFYLYILGNANRLSRLVAFFRSEGINSMYAYMQMQMKAAYAAAHWFGDADRSLRYLPVAYADAMPSAAALLFGKWFTLAVAALFAAFGALLTWLWFVIKDPSTRMFILFWGGSMVAAAMFSFFQSVGFVPVVRFAPALAGCGGALALVFWTGLGVVCSLLSDKEDAACGISRGKTATVGGFWVLSFALFAFGVTGVSNSGLKFFAPLPKASRFGEFGVEAKRGEILAADGSVLAKSVKRWSVHIDPVTASKHKVAFNPDSVTNICSRLGLTPGELLELCNIEKSRYVLVRREIDSQVAQWFLSKEGRRLSRGFIIEAFQKREYPLGSNAAHVTGCIYRRRGNVTEGASGVEYTCNAVISGTSGNLVRNAGRAEQIARATPVHGGSVTTTIVPSIQEVIAKILSTAVASNRAETAWGIALDARTGGIAAMVSLPSYDPSGTRNVKKGSDYFMNNAATAVFEPGGLMKPLTYAMALDRKAVTLDTGLDHEGGVFECHGTKLYDVSGATGVLSVAEAFVKRTEIGAAKTGLMIWKDEYPEGLKKFGFGRKIGNRTVYGEAAGIVRPAKNIDSVTFSRLGLGRGLAVTGLQIANAYAAIANGGRTVAPHLVEKTVSTKGCVTLFKSEPSVQAVSEVSSRLVAALMKDTMTAAASEFAVDFAGVEIAGMIAETPIPANGNYSQSDFNVLAAGFYPANNPRWVVAIGFSKPKPEHSAGRVALPVFAEIVRKTSSMKNFGVKP